MTTRRTFGALLVFVALVLVAPHARAEEDAPASPSPPPAQTAKTPNRDVPIALGAVGVVSLLLTGMFWLDANRHQGELDTSKCAPCRKDDVDLVSRDRLAGDITLGVGLVALGVATYLLITQK